MAPWWKILCCLYGADDSTSTGTTYPDFETDISEDDSSIFDEVSELETETTDTGNLSAEEGESIWFPRSSWDYVDGKECNLNHREETSSDDSYDLQSIDSPPCWDPIFYDIRRNIGGPILDMRQQFRGNEANNIRRDIGGPILDMRLQFRDNEIFNEALTARSSSTIKPITSQDLAKQACDKKQ